MKNAAFLITLLVLIAFGESLYSQVKPLSVNIVGLKTISEEQADAVLQAKPINFKKIESYRWIVSGGKSIGSSAGNKYLLNNLKAGVYKIKVIVKGDNYDISSPLFTIMVNKAVTEEQHETLPLIHIQGLSLLNETKGRMMPP